MLLQGAGKFFFSFRLTKKGIEAFLDKCQNVIDMRSSTNVREVQRLTGPLAALSYFIYCVSDKAFFRLEKEEEFQVDRGIREGILKNKNIFHIVTYPYSPKRGITISLLLFSHGLGDEFNTHLRDRQHIMARVFHK